MYKQNKIIPIVIDVMATKVFEKKCSTIQKHLPKFVFCVRHCL